MPDCIVPGCSRPAPNNLSIRLRRADTSAVWAPNTEAYVCDTHAVQGARLTVIYEPTNLRSVEIHVHGATPAASRLTPIRSPRTGLAEALMEEVRQTTERPEVGDPHTRSVSDGL